MNTNQTLLLIFGLAAVGGVVWYVTKGRTNTVVQTPAPTGNSSGNGERNNILDDATNYVNSGKDLLDSVGSAFGF